MKAAGAMLYLTEYQPQKSSARVFPQVLFGFWQAFAITDSDAICFHQTLQGKDGMVLITAVCIIKSSISLMA